MEFDLHVRIAWIFRLLRSGDRIDVFRIGGIGDVDAVCTCLIDQRLNQEVCAFATLVVDDAGKGILPFAGFLRILIVANDWFLFI